MPVGADVAVVPAEVVYHLKLPVVPVAILAVTTANVAFAAVPAVIVPV
jgi:formylmethanofuran dehydrogenase subunit B